MTPAPPPCQIILTRPAREAQAMAEALTRLGAQVSRAPVIEFTNFIEENLEAITRVLETLHERGGWLILPSPTAIRHFSELLSRLQVPAALLHGLRIATIGRASAEALEEVNIPLDFLPPAPRAAALAQTLPLESTATPVLILGSAQTRPELVEGLEQRGARVQVLPLYAPHPNPPGLKHLQVLLEQPSAGIRLICVTSPSAVDAIFDDMPVETHEGVAPALRQKGFLAIGPTTAGRLKSHGIHPFWIEEADVPTPEGIMAAAAILTQRLATEPAP
jgi:uroporphyrinogen III methyltransferase/synthase